jgi:transposase
MNVRWIVELTDEERATLRQFIRGGSTRVRKIKRAQVLLAADKGMSDGDIAASVEVGTSTVYRIKRAFVEEGLEKALEEEPRPGGVRKLSGHEEALLIATACAKPPPGCCRWTLELLAVEMVRLTDHASISTETVRRRLVDNDLKPWQKKMWCIPDVDGEFVARMEDVLDLYSETPEPNKPVVSFDESPIQLIGETRVPIPPQPGKPARIDYEYRRNGTANLFVIVDAHAAWRHVKVTDRRTFVDFAECMRDLVDVHYPNAPLIRVVLDNLSTHRLAALYQAFSPSEARRIARRLELHYVPKHASWLNMVEIEIGVLKQQCLDRRIGARATLEREIAAWQAARNASGAKICWMFDVARAREKMRHAYPEPTPTERGSSAVLPDAA